MSDPKGRIKIPSKIEADVMFHSDRQCCVDQKRGVHIHHIDGKPGNNDFDNLALLCFECHDDATKTGSLSKKLSPLAIIKFKEHHYNVIKERRMSEVNSVTKKKTNPTYDDYLNVSIQANVLIEIAKIRLEYVQSIKMDRNEILLKLYAYTDYNFPRVCAELFEFLNKVTYETRSGLPYEMILSVTSIVEDYFPPKDNNITKSQIEKVGKLALQIAFGIIYDTSIHSHNFGSMNEGYQLLQFIYISSLNLKNNNLKKEIENTLNEIERNLNRPNRKDLEMAKSLFIIYKNHLSSQSPRYPELSPEIIMKIQSEK